MSIMQKHQSHRERATENVYHSALKDFRAVRMRKDCRKVVWDSNFSKY